MRTSIYLLLLCILAAASSCSPSALSGFYANSKEGRAIIQHENGKYSEPMGTLQAFAQLKSNEKIHLSPGRVEFSSPIGLEGLQNIEIIGKNTSLVAKIDMPIISLTKVRNVKMRGLHVVHEIGEWCAQNCIEFYQSSNLDIRDCKMDGSGYFGLALTNVENATVENNEFFNCEYGLAAWKSKGLTVKGNRFYKNRGEDIMVNDKGQFTNDIHLGNTFGEK